MTTLTIDRTSLELDPLVIDTDCPDPTGFVLGLGTVRPEFKPRYDYAPDSAWIGGKQLLGVVKDQGEIAVIVFVKAEDATALGALKAELEEALWQFIYTVTFDDGVAKSYFADPTVPSWGEIVPVHDKIFVAKAVISIPVSP